MSVGTLISEVQSSVLGKLVLMALKREQNRPLILITIIIVIIIIISIIMNVTIIKAEFPYRFLFISINNNQKRKKKQTNYINMSDLKAPYILHFIGTKYALY